MDELKEWRRRGERSLAAAAPTLVLFTLQRLVAISAMRWVGGPDWMTSIALRYDAGWYLGIVTAGYDDFPRVDASGSIVRTNLAFFPLYPGIATAVHRLLPVSPELALLIVAWVSSLIAAGGLFLIGRHLGGPAAGMALALLWGASPQSIVLVMGYSESLASALLVLALYALLRDRPLAAAFATALAGLSRPTATALVAIVGLWLVVQILRKARDRESVAHPWWVLLVSLLLTPTGLAAVLGFVAHKTGSLLGYFQVQGQWNMVMGSPLGALRLMARALFPVGEDASLAAVYVPVLAGYLALLVIVAGWLFPRVRTGYGWLAAYTVLGAGLALTNQSYFHSIARHLMGVVTLLLPLLDLKTRRWSVALVLVAASVATSWWGANLVAQGHFSP